MNSSFQQILAPLRKLLKPDTLEKDLQETIRAAEKNPSDLRLKIKLGELYFRKRELEKGVAVFKEVAQSYLKSGFVLKAIAVYKSIIQTMPGSVEFNERLAELYQQLGMVQDAMVQYLIVMNYYQNHQQKEEVLRAARKMVELDPKDVYNRIRLAETYFNQNLEEEALKEYEAIGNQLRSEEDKKITLLIDVLEKIFFRRPKEKALLQEICLLFLKNHNPQAAIRKIEKHKLKEDPLFKEIYEEALKMQEAISARS